MKRWTWAVGVLLLAGCDHRQEVRDTILARHNLECARAVGSVKTQMERAAIKLRCLEHEQNLMAEWGASDQAAMNAAVIAGAVGAAAGASAARSSAPVGRAR